MAAWRGTVAHLADLAREALLDAREALLDAWRGTVTHRAIRNRVSGRVLVRFWLE